jgi:predicted acetyltransferase
MTVSLQPVEDREIGKLEQLLGAYVKELNPLTPHPIVGRYPYLDDYFTDPTRHAFFILDDGEIAGFVFVRQIGATTHEISEFSISPRNRGLGLGSEAARLVFRHFPGTWELSVLRANIVAQAFWTGTIGELDPDYRVTVTDDEDANFRFIFKV